MSQLLRKCQCAGYFASFGLIDQPNAFELDQRHIPDFGGDPANVTAFGAGNGSLHMHILSGKALFDRAILMSGSCPVMGPYPLQLLEKGWKTLFEAVRYQPKPLKRDWRNFVRYPKMI
jgi:carboxylesterase type B